MRPVAQMRPSTRSRVKCVPKTTSYRGRDRHAVPPAAPRSPGVANWDNITPLLARIGPYRPGISTRPPRARAPAPVHQHRHTGRAAAPRRNSPRQLRGQGRGPARPAPRGRADCRWARSRHVRGGIGAVAGRNRSSRAARCASAGATSVRGTAVACLFGKYAMRLHVRPDQANGNAADTSAHLTPPAVGAECRQRLFLLRYQK